MELDPDFSEFIACCVARDVRFLIVGGYALAAHGHPRFTKEIDIWLWIDPGNGRRVVEALDDFGFGSLGLTVDDFVEPRTSASGRLQDLADVEALSAGGPAPTQDGERGRL